MFDTPRKGNHAPDPLQSDVGRPEHSNVTAEIQENDAMRSGQTMPEPPGGSK